tara:strand:- start:129 stop:1007 length:879 start_codon:yes stop_codon:yes gene_type:complete
MENISYRRRKLENFINQIKKIDEDIQFTMLEIGCLDLNQEPFYELLEFFPGSKLIGFEAETSDCERMNSNAKEGVRYYPILLGGKNEIRTFYVTQAQMCCSLYEPNYELNNLYNNLQCAELKDITQVETVTMDKFVIDNNIGPVDFIKIDVQGAELEIFKSGNQVLKNVLSIVSEVMFIPHYKEQPLFGDIAKFLDNRGLMFHKFLGFGGRTLKPFVFNNNPNKTSQQIWSDTLFLRNVQNILYLENKEMLKLSILSFLYGCYDFSLYCMAIYEKKNSMNIMKEITESFNAE